MYDANLTLISTSPRPFHHRPSTKNNLAKRNFRILFRQIEGILLLAMLGMCKSGRALFIIRQWQALLASTIYCFLFY